MTKGEKMLQECGFDRYIDACDKSYVKDNGAYKVILNFCINNNNKFIQSDITFCIFPCCNKYKGDSDAYHHDIMYEELQAIAQRAKELFEEN